MHYQTHNEEFRYGSARFADYEDIHSAGLLDKNGLPLGHFDNDVLRLDSDGARLTIAGAGGGKTTTLLSYILCLPNTMPMMVLDPRGELASISIHTLALQSIYGYYWNPKRLHCLPFHSINPLDDITLDSPHLHTDIQIVAQDLIPLSGGGNSQFFEMRARDWAGAMMKSRVEQDGFVSLPSFYRMANKIEGDPRAWADELEAMLNSRFEDVQRTASEMLTKQQDTPKEFGSILGEIYAHISFLHDPDLRASLEGGDFSLSGLVGQSRTARLHLMPPAEFIGLWSSVLRNMFSRVMTLKSRSPQARRVLLLVDEAGQLGKADFLLKAFTFSRGAGLVVHAFFQDIGQIRRNLGADAVISFMGSAVVRQFFGIRDYQTAQLVSNMLGQETLIYDDEAAQARARKEARARGEAVLYGADPFENANDYAHYEEEAQRRSKMRRPLMSADEIMNMREDQQIIFISGQNLPPILASKYPYFTRREMAGLYLPNPYHPPVDRVQVQGMLLAKWLPVHSIAVPHKYRLFPQYQGGTALQIEGYQL
ncbi:MAG: hypothetical protein COA43_04865 [Robiginitomaculum sp.]|nr:MAG: hypothetical protein COA43_04865 [Robiginitomaculum sp.]